MSGEISRVSLYQKYSVGLLFCGREARGHMSALCWRWREKLWWWMMQVVFFGTVGGDDVTGSLFRHKRNCFNFSYHRHQNKKPCFNIFLVTLKGNNYFVSWGNGVIDGVVLVRHYQHLYHSRAATAIWSQSQHCHSHKHSHFHNVTTIIGITQSPSLPPPLLLLLSQLL